MQIRFALKRLGTCAAGAVLLGALGCAQTPAAAQNPAPKEVKKAEARGPVQDWPGIGRYHEANVNLAAPSASENRVVFMGDSITDAWGKHFDKYFAGKPYIGRGISGQTTPQMVVRFRPDVIALGAKVVVILAGTNDIAGNTGPETPEMIEDNFASMVDLAKANGIRVVLCSILPVYDYPWRRGLEPAPKIAALNQWLKEYAAKSGSVYVDYFSAMVDERPGCKAELCSDGVHPTDAGYTLMVPLVEKGIAEALAKN
jgi:lysophospholipase L1-like esterase